MARIHVCLDLEDEAGESLVGGADDARIGQPRRRRWCELDQRLEERLEAEVRQRAAEEHRRLPSGAIRRDIEGGAGDADHVQRLAEMRVGALADHRPRFRVVQPGHVQRRPILSLRLAFVQHQRLLLHVVDAAKRLGVADRPVDGRGRDAERALEIVEQLHRIFRGTVELVDERQDRQAVAPAHLEQLARLVLDAVGRVDHHHHAVGGDQGAIGVFTEIAMAGRVEQRHAAPLELEFERRGGDRDAALLLERHPVGRRLPPVLAPANRAGELNRAGIQQQLLRQRGLAGVGVRDDGERPPPRHFAVEIRGGGGVGGLGEFGRRGVGDQAH